MVSKEWICGLEVIMQVKYWYSWVINRVGTVLNYIDTGVILPR